MSMTMVRFRIISAKRRVHYKCPDCLKSRQITITVDQTLNPWNKGKDGFPKSALEIQREVQDEASRQASAFLRHPGRCHSCKDAPHAD